MWWLCDTGAQANVVLAKHANHIMPLDKEVLKSVTGSVLPIIGTTFLVLQRGDLSIAAKFFVAEETLKLCADGILGFPFLKANKAIIQTEEMKITLRGRTFKMLPVKPEEAIVSVPQSMWTCNTINVNFTNEEKFLGPGTTNDMVSTIRVCEIEDENFVSREKSDSPMSENKNVNKANNVSENKNVNKTNKVSETKDASEHQNVSEIKVPSDSKELKCNEQNVKVSTKHNKRDNSTKQSQVNVVSEQIKVSAQNENRKENECDGNEKEIIACEKTNFYKEILSRFENFSVEKMGADPRGIPHILPRVHLRKNVYVANGSSMTVWGVVEAPVGAEFVVSPLATGFQGLYVAKAIIRVGHKGRVPLQYLNSTGKSRLLASGEFVAELEPLQWFDVVSQKTFGDGKGIPKQDIQKEKFVNTVDFGPPPEWEPAFGEVGQAALPGEAAALPAGHDAAAQVLGHSSDISQGNTQEAVDFLKENLKLDHLAENDKERLLKFLCNYCDAFKTPGTKIEGVPGIRINLDTGDAPPVNALSSTHYRSNT